TPSLLAPEQLFRGCVQARQVTILAAVLAAVCRPTGWRLRWRDLARHRVVGRVTRRLRISGIAVLMLVSGANSSEQVIFVRFGRVQCGEEADRCHNDQVRSDRPIVAGLSEQCCRDERSDPTCDNSSELSGYGNTTVSNPGREQFGHEA